MEAQTGRITGEGEGSKIMGGDGGRAAHGKFHSLDHQLPSRRQVGWQAEEQQIERGVAHQRPI